MFFFGVFCTLACVLAAIAVIVVYEPDPPRRPSTSRPDEE